MNSNRQHLTENLRWRSRHGADDCFERNIIVEVQTIGGGQKCLQPYRAKSGLAEGQAFGVRVFGIVARDNDIDGAVPNAFHKGAPTT